MNNQIEKQSKKHHYVPKGLLRHFCYDGDKIHYYNSGMPEDGIVSRNISNKFLRFHYYSIETAEGRKSDVLEREFLQVLDSRIADFVKNFIRIFEEGKLPVIDDDTRGFLKQFVYFHTKRNPDFMESIGFLKNPKAHVVSAIQEYESLYGAVDDKVKQGFLSQNKIAELADSTRVRMMARQSPKIMDRLSRMNVHVAFAPANKQFVIGSNPVVRFENKKGGELGDGTVELWTPLTPKFCLGFSGPSSNAQTYLELEAKDVRKLNSELVRSSSEVAGASVDLLRSLLRL